MVLVIALPESGHLFRVSRVSVRRLSINLSGVCPREPLDEPTHGHPDSAPTTPTTPEPGNLSGLGQATSTTPPLFGCW